MYVTCPRREHEATFIHKYISVSPFAHVFFELRKRDGLFRFQIRRKKNT